MDYNAQNQSYLPANVFNLTIMAAQAPRLLLIQFLKDLHDIPVLAPSHRFSLNPLPDLVLVNHYRVLRQNLTVLRALHQFHFIV